MYSINSQNRYKSLKNGFFFFLKERKNKDKFKAIKESKHNKFLHYLKKIKIKMETVKKKNAIHNQVEIDTQLN